MSVRTRPSVRIHGLGLGTSLPLSLIWSPSYAKNSGKNIFGLSRVKLLVVEICKNTVLLERFVVSHVKKFSKVFGNVYGKTK